MTRRSARESATTLRLLASVCVGRLLLGTLLACLTVLMGMGLLGLSGWFIAATALAGAQAATAIVFDVFMPSAGIRLLALGRTASRYAERLVTHDATLGVIAALRERLFRGWARPEAAHRLLLRPARLLFRITADVDALESLYLRVAVPVLAALGAAIAAGVVFAVIKPWAGVALAAWLLAVGGAITWQVARRARSASVQRGLAMEALRARTVDLVAGQTELVMAGRIAAQCGAVMAAERRLARADAHLNTLEARAGFGLGLAGSAALAATLWGAGALATQGAIGPPVAVLMLLVALTASEPLSALRRGALEAGRTALALRRVAPRLAEAPEAEERPEEPPAGLCVRLHGAALGHAGAPVPALPCVDLEIALGERVALIGPSGSGKSTLMAAIAGELRPRAGVLQMLPACWLTQRTELFQDTLRDNLRLADPAADDGRILAALDAAGLAADVRALAQGLDTHLGEGGLGLSGGQARRLALARLLLRPSTLWLLDEPTEGLDTRTSCDVLQRLAARAAGRSVLIVAHLRREAELADRLLRLEGGRLIEDVRRGTPRFEAALRSLRQD